MKQKKLFSFSHTEKLKILKSLTSHLFFSKLFLTFALNENKKLNYEPTNKARAEPNLLGLCFTRRNAKGQ